MTISNNFYFYKQTDYFQSKFNNNLTHSRGYPIFEENNEFPVIRKNQFLLMLKTDSVFS